jgi:hypothetical protein
LVHYLMCNHRIVEIKVGGHEVRIIGNAWLVPTSHLRNPRLNGVPRPKLRPLPRW